MGQTKPVTVTEFARMKRKGRKIAVLTAYDATFARLFDAAGVDALLVGDSVGMTMQGQPNTLCVTMDQMVYHTQMVIRGVARAHVVVDLPFLSYQVSIAQGVENAGRLIKEGGAHAVKLEGGRRHADLISRLTAIGIPVMGHVGLTPQSVLSLGGFKKQGTDAQAAKNVWKDAEAVQEAGAYAVVLESIPAALAEQITKRLTIPTIGIGAGAACDGQVLVSHDVLGLDADFTPPFARAYENLAARIGEATSRYVADVKEGGFPVQVVTDESQKPSRKMPNTNVVALPRHTS